MMERIISVNNDLNYSLFLTQCYIWVQNTWTIMKSHIKTNGNIKLTGFRISLKRAKYITHANKLIFYELNQFTTLYSVRTNLFIYLLIN